MAARDPFQRLIYYEKSFGLPGIIMFGRYQHSASDVGLQPHSHLNAIEICFLERGEQTYRVGNLICRLRGNDQFFTLPGEVHDTANLPQERGILYWLILSLESRRKFLGLAEPLASRLKRELRRMPTRHFRGHPECASLLGEIVDLLPKRRAKRQSAVDSLRQLRLQSLLLQYLTLTVEASRRGVHGAASPLIQRVLQYIEKHLDEPVHVPRLAEIARLSESRFKARFKRETGVPPAEFWLRQKITRATALLKTRNVTEVAHGLGFSSSQYFATVFKRYTLESPSRFRAG
jgi:AraC-like DNA-binding protein